MNFVYCFDNNYNLQGFTSMISLLDCVDSKVNIHVIHNDILINKQIPLPIINHKNLKNLRTYKFDENGYYFPNIPNTHISEATYYRLFIENYLPNNINNFVYLDADVVCLKNPIPKIKKELKEIENKNLLFAARTELKKSDILQRYINEHEMPWNRLKIDENYFNAGVLIVNFKKWKESKFTSKFLDKLIELNENIIMWDQDVLNAVINGLYLELDKNFNYKDNDFEIELDKNNFNFENIIFYHYAGSAKPWKTNGAFRKSSRFYHDNFTKISNRKFHITHVNLTNSINDFKKEYKNNLFANLDNKYSYIYEFIKSLIIRLIRGR